MEINEHQNWKKLLLESIVDQNVGDRNNENDDDNGDDDDDDDKETAAKGVTI